MASRDTTLAMTANTTGAVLMMASMAAFTTNDVLIKLTGGAVPLGQMLFLRGLVSVGLILVFARWLGRIRFDVARRDWGRIGLRCLAEVGAAYFFITALLNMPIANATAILQALLRCWPTDRLSVADRGLREGILYALMSADGMLEDNPID